MPTLPGGPALDHPTLAVDRLADTPVLLKTPAGYGELQSRMQ